ncbi:unnamed protein product [Paramecium primaurelia]|uniref:Serine aminopeptidase S33 domain-containing protein n=2 Tax=Paramecium TaxID=5884 RepID=A0A8S1XV08_9CILI|nr:unnamed protein product [Paramecium primaurelia]CAD8204877.1 unnamed protein product [Paramecium pentaurelia]
MNINQQLYYTDTHKDNCYPYSYALILVHGNITSSQHWFKFIQEIQKRDQDKQIRIINLDQKGFGYSQLQNNSIDDIKDLTTEIHNLILSLFKKEEISQKVILCGWSLGGAVCLQLASDKSEYYHKLILVASAGCHGNHLYMEDEEGKQLSIKCQTKQQIMDHSKIKHNLMKIKQNDYNYFYHVFKKALFNSGRYPSDLELLELLKDVFKQSNYVDVAWALQKFDITHQVNKIKGPVFLYHGQLDRICPISDAYTNIHFIGKNKCTIVVHQDVSHMPPLEVPEDLAVHIINYLYSLK